MSDSEVAVEVKILGLSLTLYCPPEGEKDLREAVQHVSDTVDKVLANASEYVTSNTARVALMACLYVSIDYLQLKSPDSGFSNVTYGEFVKNINQIMLQLDRAIDVSKRENS